MLEGYAAKPWLAHYPEEVPPTLSYPDQPLYRWLEQAAQDHGDRTAIIFYGAELTYQELWEQSRRAAAGLKGFGVRKGDRVAIMLPNCPQGVIAYYGALMAGAIVTQINPTFTTREIKYQLGDSGARILIALDEAFSRVQGCQLDRLVLTSLHEYMPAPARWLAQLRSQAPQLLYGGTVFRWKDFLSRQPLSRPTPVNPSTDLALIQYTGATTGLPKGCMLTHRNLVTNVVQAAAWCYRLHEINEVRILASLPFFHVYGMTMCMNLPVSMAGTMLIQPKFDVRETLSIIDRHSPAFFSGSPTMFVGINHASDLDRYDLTSLEFCMSGAAPLPEEVQETFQRLTGCRLVEGYGLTEASPVTHAAPFWNGGRTGSIGLPWPDTEARVVDSATGEDVPCGEIGQLVLRGPQVMKGYWNKAEATADVLRDGWLYTGDVARMDEDGFFYIVDRQKDVIIAGGFNIYPREVEEILYAHPNIKEAAVVGVPDGYRGETVKAVVVLERGKALTEEQVVSYCREHLASYKIPRQVEFRSELPRSAAGKVLRRVLREECQPQREVG